MIFPVPKPLFSSDQPATKTQLIGPELFSHEAEGDSRWAQLVKDIQAGSPAAVEQLYEIFDRGVRFQLCRQLGPQDLDDRIHDSFVIVLQAIQRDEIREPERLLGFIRTVAKRQVCSQIHTVVTNRREMAPIEPETPLPDRAEDPERSFLRKERLDVMRRAMSRMNHRDREILTRFYLREEAQETICRSMRLTDTQFRLLKSRAKARLGELGRKDLIRTLFPRRSPREESAE